MTATLPLPASSACSDRSTCSAGPGHRRSDAGSLDDEVSTSFAQWVSSLVGAAETFPRGHRAARAAGATPPRELRRPAAAPGGVTAIVGPSGAGKTTSPGGRSYPLLRRGDVHA